MITLPPVLRNIFSRAGKYLDDAAWQRVVGYAEALAEARRRMEGPPPTPPQSPAYGCHVPEDAAGAQAPDDDAGSKAS